MLTNLDGIWEFAWTKNEEEVAVYDSFAAVPGCFDAEGLRFNQRGIGHYRRKITLSGKKQRLKIASFGLHALVFLSGEKLAESSFAWSPLIVDLPEGRAGEHLLEIRVDNFIKGHVLFIDRYDFYGFGGIYDHVTLEDVPENEITSLQITPLDYTTGEISVKVESSAEVLRIAFDGKMEEVYPNTGELRLTVPDFKLWSPESPFLHTIRVNGRTEEFGIRVLDWSGEHLKLNGKPVTLWGVNRHESHPEFGAATPESLIVSDLLRIKKAGLNFIRGSHYPQREFFFKTCDRLGLMVWEEPLSWGNRAEELNETFLSALGEQLELTIENSYNHPSLIIHGFLNECASDTQEGYEAVKRMMEICHKLDRSRPAAFASNRPARDICFDLTDIVCMNVYPGWYGEDPLEKIKSRIGNFAELSPGKVKVISEIGAGAMYGFHSAEPFVPWSEEYQSEFTRQVVEAVLGDDRWSGFMLWVFCNANTYTDTMYRVNRPRGYNNKGLLDEYRRPKRAFLDLPGFMEKFPAS